MQEKDIYTKLLQTNPILYIVMGPNGAGKSTFGKLFVKETPIFDPDKRYMDIEKHWKSIPRARWPKEYLKYPEDYEERLFKEIRGDEFRYLIDASIKENKNFAFETPFSFWGHEYIEEFKNKGYYIKG